MRDRLEFDVSFGANRRSRDDEAPMRLLLIGDFSGAPVSERPPLTKRPALQVDVDTFDSVMKRLAPRINARGRTLTFETLDAFHPDQLRRLDFFTSSVDRQLQPMDDDDTFARLIGTAAPAEPAPKPSGNQLDAFIRELIAPHVVKPESPQMKARQQAADAVLGDDMRALLHAPDFQAREAAWRGVHWLTTSLELDEHLQLYLFDVSRQELLADLASAGGRITETSIHAALVERWRHVPGADGWSLFATLLRLGDSDDDVGLLAGLGLLGAEAGAPVLADADPSLLSAGRDPSSPWSQLRRSNVARWIGLAAPRVLLRAPYGSRGEVVDFPFDERAGGAGHEQLLWGHAALGLALLIGQAFTAHGWDFEPGDVQQLEGLPAYTYEQDGETVMQAAAERFLTERELQEWLDAGIIPVASRRDRHAAVVVRFQSIADPPLALAW